MRVPLVLALLMILTTYRQVHAFVITRVGEKSSSSSLFALNDDNEVSLSQSRRRRYLLLQSSSTTISFLSLLSLLPSNPASASLLDEYGLIRPQLIMENKKRAQK